MVAPVKEKTIEQKLWRQYNRGCPCRGCVSSRLKGDVSHVVERLSRQGRSVPDVFTAAYLLAVAKIRFNDFANNGGDLKDINW